MAEIKSEKEAIEALENGLDFNQIPKEFRKLEAVNLAAVNNCDYYLMYTEIQTFDICLAAFKMNDDEAMLKYVDPDQRTNALLKACEIDDEWEDFGEFEPITIDDNYGWQDHNEINIITVYGKVDSDCLEIAQKHFLRSINADCD